MHAFGEPDDSAKTAGIAVAPSRSTEHVSKPDQPRITLVEAGLTAGPDDMGENMTTRGIALLELPAGPRLRFGRAAVVELTGLRNPCTQLDRCQRGLLRAVLDRLPNGSAVRKSGVMSSALTGGNVAPGDPIEIELPTPLRQRLGVI